jgi:hypothetical protein
MRQRISGNALYLRFPRAERNLYSHEDRNYETKITQIIFVDDYSEHLLIPIMPNDEWGGRLGEVNFVLWIKDKEVGVNQLSQ